MLRAVGPSARSDAVCPQINAFLQLRLLNVASGIKGQICTVEERLVRKVVGKITATDRAALDALLRKWLDL